MLSIKKFITLLLFSACTSCGDGNFNISDSSDGDNRNNDNSQTTNIIEPNEEKPVPPNTPLPGEPNPICTEVMGVDGPGEFVWKAISESDGKLALLFPTRFTEVFLKVSVVLSTLGIEEEGRFVDFTNGQRQTYRFSRPGGDYTGRVIAESSTSTCIWEVSNPSIRQD